MAALRLVTPLAAKILLLHGELASWRKVGASLGVSGGMAYRVANGYEPKAPSIRTALGLPVLTPVVTSAPAGTLIMGEEVTCRCGRVFVGKWGTRRRLCPICRPARTVVG